MVNLSLLGVEKIWTEFKWNLLQNYSFRLYLLDSLLITPFAIILIYAWLHLNFIWVGSGVLWKILLIILYPCMFKIFITSWLISFLIYKLKSQVIKWFSSNSCQTFVYIYEITLLYIVLCKYKLWLKYQNEL